MPQPVKILGVGNPIKDNCDPSVPPRIGSVLGTMSKASKTRLGISMMCFKGSIFSAMLKYWSCTSTLIGK